MTVALLSALVGQRNPYGQTSSNPWRLVGRPGRTRYGPGSPLAIAPVAVSAIAVHDSQVSWESFRDNILIPRMQQGIDGFPTPPTETTIDLYSIVP